MRRKRPASVSVASPERLQWLTDGFCAVTEAAELLGLDVSTVRRMVERHEAVHYKLGDEKKNGAIRVSRRWIAEFVASRLRGPNLG
jgi:excisionase family DNA binding protein